MKNLTDAEKLLLEIATESGTYETEYDGRMYTFCFHCDVNVGEGHDHEPDCRIGRAQAALGDVWTQHLEAEESKRLAEIAAVAKQQANARAKQAARDHERERIPCTLCGRKVARMGMREHQRTPACSTAAAEARTGIKCVTKAVVDDTTPRCACCKKPMPGAHPNKRFCSNRGRGNCKDRFNNLRPGRIGRAILFSGSGSSVASDNDFSYTLGDDDPSWDAHKDSW